MLEAAAQEAHSIQETLHERRDEEQPVTSS
jgi:hypothetical protein